MVIHLNKKKVFEKRNTPGPYALSFMFEAYKMGYLITKVTQYSQYAVKALKYLVQDKYVEIPRLPHTTQSVIFLTPKGAEFVKTKFLEALRTYKLHHNYPLLVQDDVITISKDLKNEGLDGFGFGYRHDMSNKIYVSKPHDTLYQGDYRVRQASRSSILTTSENDNMQYRMRTFNVSEFAKLKLNPTLNFDMEFSKRFGKINVKALTKRLQKFCNDNFQIMTLMSKLYESPIAQDRLEMNAKAKPIVFKEENTRGR